MTRDPATKPVVIRDDGLPWCPDNTTCPWFETPEESGGPGWRQFCSRDSTQIPADGIPGRPTDYLCKLQMTLDQQELMQLRQKNTPVLTHLMRSGALLCHQRLEAYEKMVELTEFFKPPSAQVTCLICLEELGRQLLYVDLIKDFVGKVQPMPKPTAQIFYLPDAGEIVADSCKDDEPE